MGFNANQGGFGDFSGFEQFTNMWGQQGQGQGFENIFGNFEDFFNFGQKKAYDRPTRGEDIVIHLEISF